MGTFAPAPSGSWYTVSPGGKLSLAPSTTPVSSGSSSSSSGSVSSTPKTPVPNQTTSTGTAARTTTPVSSATPTPAVAAVQAAVPVATVAYQATPRGWSNVWDVFTAPWKGQGISVMGKNIPVVSPAISVVTGVVEVGAVAYGAALAFGAPAGAAAAGTGAAGMAGSAGTNSLRNLAIAGGVGYVIGASGGKPQDMTTTQAQTPSGTSTPEQQSNQYDYSQKYLYQNQYTNNTIANSPGATLGGSPSQAGTIPSTLSQYPTQAAPFGQTLGQSATPTQTDSGGLLIPALIIGAALIFSK